MAGVQRRRVRAGSRRTGRRRRQPEWRSCGSAAAGWAKRATQASHTGCAGQARHTAHWLGSGGAQALRSSGRSIGSIYSRAMPYGRRRPPTIDPAAAARLGAASRPPRSPWLHEEVARRMEDRLQWIKAGAQGLGRLGAGAGRPARRRRCVERRYPRGRVLRGRAGAGAAPRLAQAARQALVAPRWAGRARHRSAPARRRRADALGQHGAAHGGRPAGADRALASRAGDRRLPDVLLPGPDTLRELRALYAALGLAAAGHEFTDMHDWGDMLVHAGFAEPVMDMERITLTWETPGAPAGRNCASWAPTCTRRALPALARPRLASRGWSRRWPQRAARTATAGWR